MDLVHIVEEVEQVHIELQQDLELQLKLIILQ